jgi:hypothetical protein
VRSVSPYPVAVNPGDSLLGSISLGGALGKALLNNYFPTKLGYLNPCSRGDCGHLLSKKKKPGKELYKSKN